MKAGDTVYRRGKNGKPKEEIIEKVGRKYVFIKHCRAKFDINTLREVDYTGWSDKLYLSEQIILDQDEYNSLFTIINKAFDWIDRNRYSLDQLRKICGILGESEKTYKDPKI